METVKAEEVQSAIIYSALIDAFVEIVHSDIRHGGSPRDDMVTIRKNQGYEFAHLVQERLAERYPEDMRAG